MIIGLCGAQGAGKDTVGNILVEKYGFQRISFASALKDMISSLFQWPRELLEGNTEESRQWRETVNEFWARKTNIPDFSPRKALQLIGTDCLRNHFCKDIWVYIVESRIAELLQTDPKARIVLTDCRFINEMEMISRFSNSFVVKIERNLTKESSSFVHASEVDWQRFPFQHVIENNESIEDLDHQILKFFTTFLI
jgi:dephospho-CoA kinase